MTREEAIIQLRLGPGINEDVSEEYNEAAEMAIEALEQWSCEDAISRARLIQTLDAWDHDVNAIPNYAWKVIRESPSVNTQESMNIMYYPQVEGITPMVVEPETDVVLDKIKAEIIENSIEDYVYHGCGSDELIIGTNEVLKIIDKYKSESEKEK